MRQPPEVIPSWTLRLVLAVKGSGWVMGLVLQMIRVYDGIDVVRVITAGTDTGARRSAWRGTK